MFVRPAWTQGLAGVAREMVSRHPVTQDILPALRERLCADTRLMVGEQSEGEALSVIDRGGDGTPTLRMLLEEGHRAIVRVARLNRIAPKMGDKPAASRAGLRKCGECGRIIAAL